MITIGGDRMMKRTFLLIPLSAFLFSFLSFSPVRSQTQTAAPTPSAPAEETLEPAQFTETLKQVWIFLKEEMTKHVEAVEKKNEFETSKEFERRVTDLKQQYLARVIKYSRDQKLDQRVIGVLFKATPVEYNADKQSYKISSPTVVEAPYNIPTVQSVIRNNPYVALADSIRSGYRTSSIYLKFKPHFQWQTTRETAQSAKGDAESLFFKVRFSINIESAEVKQPAILNLVPREILLLNNKTNQIFWSQRIF